MCQNLESPSRSLDVLRHLIRSPSKQDSLLGSSDYVTWPDLQMYPAVGGAVVPIYNIPNMPAGKKLILSPSLVSKIFSGQIRQWYHPDILALNDADVGKSITSSRVSRKRT